MPTQISVPRTARAAAGVVTRISLFCLLLRRPVAKRMAPRDLFRDITPVAGVRIKNLTVKHHRRVHAEAERCFVAEGHLQACIAARWNLIVHINGCSYDRSLGTSLGLLLDLCDRTDNGCSCSAGACCSNDQVLAVATIMATKNDRNFGAVLGGQDNIVVQFRGLRHNRVDTTEVTAGKTLTRRFSCQPASFAIRLHRGMASFRVEKPNIPATALERP